MLPDDVRGILRAHPNRDQLLEVVLDLGRRPEARFAGDIANEFLRDEVISQADLDAAVSRLLRTEIESVGTDAPSTH